MNERIYGPRPGQELIRMEQYSLALLDPGDQEVLSAVYGILAEEKTREHFVIGELTPERIAETALDNNIHIFVLYEGEDIVGTITLEDTTPRIQEDKIQLINLHSLIWGAVDRERRGEGLGKTLLMMTYYYLFEGSKALYDIEDTQLQVQRRGVQLRIKTGVEGWEAMDAISTQVGMRAIYPNPREGMITEIDRQTGEETDYGGVELHMLLQDYIERRLFLAGEDPQYKRLHEAFGPIDRDLLNWCADHPHLLDYELNPLLVNYLIEQGIIRIDDVPERAGIRSFNRRTTI